MSGRLLLGAAVVVAAYLKGRMDGAVADPVRRAPWEGAAETAATRAPEPAAAAAAETAAAAAPPAPLAETEPGAAEWERLLAALTPDAPRGVLTDDPRVDELAPGWAAPDGAPATAGDDTAIPEPVPAPSVPEAADPEVAPVATGTFTITGLAVNAGDLAFGRVTFPHRLAEIPDPGAITLVVEEAENLPAAGVAVMGDGGFAPCREGMTLIVAAEGPGRFVARGRYRVDSAPRG